MSDLSRVLLLMTLAAMARLTVIANAEVAARDSVGFIRLALQLEGPQWRGGLPAGERTVFAALRDAEQPPGYPLAVLVTSWPIRAVRGTTPESMALAAQLASLGAGVLLVLPLYALGREMFGGQRGFLAAALVTMLPAVVKAGGDGLSESTFLLAAAVALWLGVTAARDPSVMRLVAAGVGVAIAYLIRPEGVLLAASGVVAAVISGRIRLVAAVAVGFFMVAGPYMAVIGRFSNKPTVRFVSEPATATERSGGPPFALVMAEFRLDRGNGAMVDRALWAATAVGRETFKTAHYGVGVLGAIGLWTYRRRLVSSPALATVVAAAGLHLVAVTAMASRVGYVSERHTLPLVLVAGLFAAAALPLVARRLPGRHAGIILVGVMLAADLPALTKSLHVNRAGHRAAGVWLASHLGCDEEVIDPFCWARYHAGAMFREDVSVGRSVRYVVVDTGDATHAQLSLLPWARRLAATGEKVFEWREGGSKDTVQLYRVPPVPFPPRAAKGVAPAEPLPVPD